MDLRKKRGYQMRTYVTLAALCCLIGFGPAWVRTGYFLTADGGKKETAACLPGGKAQTGTVADNTKNKGSAGRTDGGQTMENLNRYPDPLTNEEKEMLYKVVSMECDTGYEGSLAVISCMMNRTRSDRYSDDLIEVVTEDSQFTAYYDKETGTYPYVDRVPSEECIAAVNDALYNGKRNLPSYILYFRSSDYDSLQGYETYGQIGDNTYFYLDEDREEEEK